MAGRTCWILYVSLGGDEQEKKPVRNPNRELAAGLDDRDLNQGGEGGRTEDLRDIYFSFMHLARSASQLQLRPEHLSTWLTGSPMPLE